MKNTKIATIIFIFNILFGFQSAFAASQAWNLNTAAEYTVSDASKVQISGGNGNLIFKANPTHVGAISDNATTELGSAREIITVGNYAYIASFLDDGVEILDISNPANPTHVGAISDNATTELDGARGIDVVGNYAYIASYNDSAVEILDISNPANPTHVGSIDDATCDTANGSACELSGAWDIRVIGSYAYVTANFDDGVEILNISNPANPTHVGSITDNGVIELDGAGDIIVLGNYAYVTANFDDGVEILNISNPANPTHVGSITDDVTTNLDQSRGIDVVGNYAYIASFLDDGVEILDISNPANPTHVGAISDNATTELDGVIDIFVSGNYAYVTANVDDGVEILDISNPANPTHVGAISDNATTELDGARIITVVGNYAYVTGEDDDGFEILDISKFASNSPYIKSNNSQLFVGMVNTFSETLGANNEGIISYQVSSDNGGHWNYWNGSAWVVTMAIDGTQTSLAAAINANITTLDSNGGDFLWRAYFDSNGMQRVELDHVDITYDVDTTPPSTPVIADLVNASDTGSLNNDDITRDITPTFNVECGELNSVITIYVDTNPQGVHTCVGIGTETATVTAALADGNHSVTYSETDAAGNESIPSPALSVMIDTTITPTTTINVPTNGSPITGIAESGSMVVATTPSGATCTTTAHITTGVYSCNLVPAPVDGENVTVVVTDSAGNTSAPGVTAIGGVDLSAPTSPTIDVTSAGATTITGTGDNGAIITLAFIPCTNSPVVVVGGIWSCNVIPGSEPQKGNTITAIATDTAGNTSTGSYTIPNPSSGGSVSYVCKDHKASNYSALGRHKASLCKYDTTKAVPPTTDNPFGGVQCPSNLLITDNMKNGDTNGVYSSYNKGKVTQISILQAHINRLLADEYTKAAGPVDNYYRSLTKQGVERIQRKLNQLLPDMKPLVIDGIVGPFTKEAINNSC